MKKRRNNFILLIGFLLISIFPNDIKAKSVKDFENEVAKYTNELQAKKDKIAKNDKEVAEIKAKISTIENQIKTTESEIKRLQREIEESNKKIEEKNEESKKLLKYFQVVSNENTYLEYIFGSTSIQEMVYRVSVVEQLTDYNKQVMEELQNLIKENNRKQQELITKQQELANLKKSLNEQRERIDADTASIRVGMPKLEEQIKAAKSNVDYYKKLGCGATEDIFACQFRVEGGASLPSSNGYYRPIQYGYITQGYKGNPGHLGVDIGSRNKSIPIYPMADGQLFFVGYDDAGALIVVLRHNVGGKYTYSTYAHMSSFSGAVSGYINYKRGTSDSIKNGPLISHNTSIGNMGSTGNSFGPHLHLEVTSCSWHKGGGCTYSVYKNKTINPASLISLPSRWENR